MTTRDKVRLNRLRRMAERQALRLVKSRTRDPYALDFNHYKLVEITTETTVAGGDSPRGFAFTLEDAEKFLTSEHRIRGLRRKER